MHKQAELLRVRTMKTLVERIRVLAHKTQHRLKIIDLTASIF